MGFTLAVSPLALVGLGLVPLLWGSYTAYELGLYLIYGMVAQGVALCWGRAGFLPLGQALFFGIGAYIAGAALSTFGNGWLVVVLAVIAASLLPALLAGSVGALVFSRQIGSGPYFSLITLALAMLGFQLANSMEEVTGGFNGMTGIPDLLPGVGRFERLYYVIVAFLGITTLTLGYLLRTPFGQLLSAISQNEERLQFFGFNTSLLKAAAFAISAGIAGFAGALYAPHQGIVTPQAVGFLLSAEFVIWTAVGGRKGLAGPVLGAVAIGFLASALRDDFLYWEVVVAIVFIGVVLRWPSGMAGMLEALWRHSGWMRGAKPSRRRNLSLDARSQERVPDLEFRVVDVRVGVGGNPQGIYLVDRFEGNSLCDRTERRREDIRTERDDGKASSEFRRYPLGRQVAGRKASQWRSRDGNRQEAPGAVRVPVALDCPERRYRHLGESHRAIGVVQNGALCMDNTIAGSTGRTVCLSGGV